MTFRKVCTLSWCGVQKLVSFAILFYKFMDDIDRSNTLLYQSLGDECNSAGSVLRFSAVILENNMKVIKLIYDRTSTDRFVLKLYSSPPKHLQLTVLMTMDFNRVKSKFVAWIAVKRRMDVCCLNTKLKHRSKFGWTFIDYTFCLIVIIYDGMMAYMHTDKICNQEYGYLLFTPLYKYHYLGSQFEDIHLSDYIKMQTRENECVNMFMLWQAHIHNYVWALTILFEANQL
jgi:hypothetical protein